MRIYSELADWYHLFTAPSEYAEEAANYLALIRSRLPDARTLLELGAGGGNNAWHLKRHLCCMLSDISPQMLAVSRRINPELEHVQGDMRTLRLARLFDVVFIHDAIDYMRTRDDLSQAAATAFAHTRPGGVALFLPDCTLETFQPGVSCGGNDEEKNGGLGIRYLEWWHPLQEGSNTHEVDFAFLLRDQEGVRTVHDRHVFSVFSHKIWLEILEAAGFMGIESPGLDPLLHEGQTAFLCRRPG